MSSPAPAAIRLTPEGEDAGRPAVSGDGGKVAYVRRAPGGEEIDVVSIPGGASRLLAGPRELAAAGLAGAGYTLHDLAWDPAGERLAFTWFDEAGWAQIGIVAASGRVTAVPSPVIEDPWEEGSSFALPSSRLLWGEDGATATFVGWDDDCGALYRIGGLAALGNEPPARPAPLPLSPACRTVFHPAPGFWLFAEFGEEFNQRLVVADEGGRISETLTFPQGRPPRVRWAASGEGGRPAILGWWNEPESAVRVLFAWEGGEGGRVIEWRRERCEGDCAEALVLASGAIFYLDGPPRGARVVSLDRPGGEPRPAGIERATDLAAGPRGGLIATVREEDGTTSLWILPAGDFATGRRLR